MADRINEGYIITDSIHIGQTEFVLGKLDSKIPMYVTWACKGGDYYYWGHYSTDLMEAKRDLLNRASEELEYLMTQHGRSGARPKEQEKEHER